MVREHDAGASEAGIGGRDWHGDEDVKKGKDRAARRAEAKLSAAATDELPTDELRSLIRSVEDAMHKAAKELEFEYAARLRDELKALRRELRELTEAGIG